MAEPGIQGDAHAAIDAPQSAGSRPPILPPGLRTDWPVPWRANPGSRGGALAWAEYLGVRGAMSAFSRLPRSARMTIIGGLARAARRFDRGHSEAAREFLRTALGTQLGAAELDARVLQAYRHFLRISLDAASFDREVPLARVREHYQLELASEAGRALESRRGCLLVTGHIGDWEAAAAILPWLGFDPLYAVSRPIKNRPLSLAAQRERERRGVRILPRRGAIKDAMTVLSAGGHVVMLLDQRARHKPVTAPFFGRSAACERGPAVLARRCRAPVLPWACYLTERPFHYRLVMPGVLWPEELAGLEPEEVAARINRQLERLILAAPEQYFWLHERYREKNRPAGKADEQE